MFRYRRVMIPLRSQASMGTQTSIICVAGPTASGKSARAIELAQELLGEVISVDSRQVYRGLDIGNRRNFSVEEMQGISPSLDRYL